MSKNKNIKKIKVLNDYFKNSNIEEYIKNRIIFLKNMIEGKNENFNV